MQNIAFVKGDFVAVSRRARAREFRGEGGENDTNRLIHFVYILRQIQSVIHFIASKWLETNLFPSQQFVIPHACISNRNKSNAIDSSTPYAASIHSKVAVAMQSVHNMHISISTGN